MQGGVRTTFRWQPRWRVNTSQSTYRERIALVKHTRCSKLTRIPLASFLVPGGCAYQFAECFGSSSSAEFTIISDIHIHPPSPSRYQMTSLVMQLALRGHTHPFCKRCGGSRCICIQRREAGPSRPTRAAMLVYKRVWGNITPGGPCASCIF